MDAGLLPRAHADGLAVHRIADGVGLGVFEGDEGHDEVPDGAVGQVLLGGDDVPEELPVDPEVVAPLLEGDAEDLLALPDLGDVVGITSTTQ